MKIATR